MAGELWQEATEPTVACQDTSKGLPSDRHLSLGWKVSYFTGHLALVLDLPNVALG